jgi:Virulence-associated protein E
MGATINPDPNSGDIPEYLNPGDRRRWWPVTIGKIDIPALIRDRDQLYAEAMRKGREFDDTWASLKLPEKFWAIAGVEQEAREVKDTARDRLAMLYSIVTATPVITSDGDAVVTIQQRLLKLGIDYMIGPSTNGSDPIGTQEVWVSAAMVIDLLPQSIANDSGRLHRAMAANGWRKVRDRRTGANLRGYVQALGKGRANVRPDNDNAADFE